MRKTISLLAPKWFLEDKKVAEDREPGCSYDLLIACSQHANESPATNWNPSEQ